MIRLVSYVNSDLPRLAWCAVVDPAAGTVEVTHGEAVEFGDDFFVEGAWDGEFAEGGFTDSLLMMGSGGRSIGDGFSFATASHTLEPMYSTHIDSRLIFSNSLPLLLAGAGLTLDPRFPHYLGILSSSRFGLKRYSKAIPTAEGVDVTMLLHCVATVDASGAVTTVTRRLPEDFRDYRHYRTFLVETLAALWKNASSPQRSVKYGMLSTTSTGYDSVCISALARDVGCTDTITFRDAVGGASDSGQKIAERLGMTAHEFCHEDCRAKDQAVLEFVACCNADIQFAACENALAGNLVLTGYVGDVIWSREYKSMWGKRSNTALVRTEFSGASLQEFRLRVGFIHVPVAMFAIGCDRSVWEITRSDEMKPWTLGTAYDRPIARRIAEEAGIPRDWFGQQKKVAVISFQHNESSLQPELAAKFKRFLEQHHCRTTAPAHNAAARLLSTSRRFARMLDKWHLLPQALRVPAYVAPPVPIRFMYPIGERSYSLPWAIGELRDTYSSALLSSPRPISR